MRMNLTQLIVDILLRLHYTFSKIRSVPSHPWCTIPCWLSAKQLICQFSMRLDSCLSAWMLLCNCCTRTLKIKSGVLSYSTHIHTVINKICDIATVNVSFRIAEYLPINHKPGASSLKRIFSLRIIYIYFLHTYSDWLPVKYLFYLLGENLSKLFAKSKAT